MNTDHLIQYLLAFAIVFDASIAWFVLLKAPKRAINQVYFAFISSITLWQVSHFLRSYFPLESASSALFVNRLALASAGLIVCALTYFVWMYPARQHRAQILQWTTGAGLVFMVVAFLPWTVGLQAGTAGYQVTFQPLYPYFMAAVFIGLLVALSVLVLRWSQTTEAHLRVQFQYLALGIAIPVVFGGFNSLYLPYLAYQSGSGFYVASAIHNLGPISTVFLSAVTGYSILRHRLMDMQVLVRRNAVTVVVLVVMLALLWIVLSALERVVGFELSQVETAAVLITFLVLVALLPPVRSLVKRFVRRLMRRGQFDLREWNEEEQVHLRRTESPQKHSRVLAADLLGRLPVENLVLLSYDHIETCLRAVYPKHLKKKFAMDEPWVEALTQDPKLYSRAQVATDFSGAVRRSLERVEGSLGAEYVMPLYYGERLVGVFFVGGRVDGKDFTTEDEELLRRFQALASLEVWSVLQIHHMTRSGLDLFLR